MVLISEVKRVIRSTGWVTSKIERRSSLRRMEWRNLRILGRLSIFEVTEHVDQMTRFTSDIRTIERGIDSLRTGPGTSIYDYVCHSSGTLMDREGRKRLVLVTDRGDTTSMADYNGAFRRAQHAQAILYSLIAVPVEDN